MRLILTSFDYTRSPPLPLQTLIVDQQPRIITLYQPKSGKKLVDILVDIEKVKQLFSEPCRVNDFKTHIKSFNLEKHISYEAYDISIPNIGHILPIELAKIAKNIPNDALIWQKLKSNVSSVYQFLENRGILDDYKKLYPLYDLDTFTGRSKSKGFNIQGANSDFDINHIDNQNKIFVHFDWIAADIRMAAFMSGDTNMEQTFYDSDPYTYITNYLNDVNFPREVVKIQVLKAFYSLDYNNPIWDIFPKFREFMHMKSDELEKNQYSISILGRKFLIKDDNKLSVFNAQFQGSVVHAMQASLIDVFKNYSNFLLTENQDSIIFCCDEKMVKPIIKDVCEIMVDPLKNYMENSPRMPLKISLGKKWRKWNFLRVYK